MSQTTLREIRSRSCPSVTDISLELRLTSVDSPRGDRCVWKMFFVQREVPRDSVWSDGDAFARQSSSSSAVASYCVRRIVTRWVPTVSLACS